ncbi:MAG: NAD-dependent DNA ligase LigA [Chloroflexi bacterium]|nr:NAD-dependent DNA ligase LigA [Chloroflexota bacterium]
MDKARIVELEKTLTEAQDAYYNGTSIMSDAEYDAFSDELRDLDPKNSVLTKVGAAPKDNRLQKVKHDIPMGSQDKVNSQGEFEAWVKKTGADKFVVQEKLDGLSVEVLYKKGRLVQASTRGSGTEGEDVTHTVSKMQNVPDTLGDFTGSLRGEIIFSKSAFAKLDKGEYSNPRNAAAGITRRKDVHKAIPTLQVIYFDCITDKLTFDKEHHKIRFMENQLKLNCVPTKVAGLDNAIKWFDHYQSKHRAELDYEIDGLVIKVNNLSEQEALGETDDRPKGQIAWKFSAEMRKTKLLGIDWDVGLTGRITPVANLKPVQIGGVTVSRSSLHNVSNMKKLGVWIGAEVLISRRGDVIPYIEEVVNPDTAVGAPYPTTCPVCANKTEFDGEYLVCKNPACPAKTKGDILKWINVLDIDQAGEAFVIAAVKAGFIKDPADLYVLSETTISTLPGYGSSSAKTLVKNINKSRELALPKFLAALNIPNAGNSTFEALDKAGFNTLQKIQAATWNDFAGISGIGDITAKAAASGLTKKRDLIQRLITNGVTIKRKIIGKLTGKSFCFTGEISIKRGDAFKLVESMGGEVKSSVSRGLTYLVQANKNSASGKAQKARTYGTQVLGEKEFFDLVEFSLKRLKALN